LLSFLPMLNPLETSLRIVQILSLFNIRSLNSEIYEHYFHCNSTNQEMFCLAPEHCFGNGGYDLVEYKSGVIDKFCEVVIQIKNFNDYQWMINFEFNYIQN
ncbi:hypothetical protein PFISCL1PPCAC_28406, partial [Pristionchus fissidentatus]